MSALQLNAVRFMCVYVMCECVSECALKLKRQTRDRNHFPKASIDDLLHIWAHFVHTYTHKNNAQIVDIFSIVSMYFGYRISMRHIDFTFGSRTPNIFIFCYRNILSISFVKQCYECGSKSNEWKEQKNDQSMLFVSPESK